MTAFKLWASFIAGAICLYVAYNEWFYYRQHPYGRGPSGELAALAFAGLLVSAVLFLEGARAYNAEKEAQRRFEYDRQLRLRADDEDD